MGSLGASFSARGAGVGEAAATGDAGTDAVGFGDEGAVGDAGACSLGVSVDGPAGVSLGTGEPCATGNIDATASRGTAVEVANVCATDGNEAVGDTVVVGKGVVAVVRTGAPRPVADRAKRACGLSTVMAKSERPGDNASYTILAGS